LRPDASVAPIAQRRIAAALQAATGWPVWPDFDSTFGNNMLIQCVVDGAKVRTSVRRIHFAIASGCPNKDEFELAHVYLQPSAPLEPPDAPKTPGLLIAMLTRALMDSHYGKPKAITRALREPRPVAGQPDRSHR
jgi:hypothetical protein